MTPAHPRRPRFPSLPQPGEGQRVLVLLCHPALHRSRMNRRLAAAIDGIDGVTVHDLYAAYPDFDIDVEHEQRLLAAHDTIVWQHPFYWYSTPALLKEWQDIVLEFGWAYGPAGTALQGKLFLSAVTTGAQADAYQPEGFNGHTMRELLLPVEQTARLCGMIPLPPFMVHGTHRLADAGMTRAAEDYRSVILALRDGRIDPAAVAGLSALTVGALRESA